MNELDNTSIKDFKREMSRNNQASEYFLGRLLNRRQSSPTAIQIHVWENDGGHIYSADYNFVIINGTVCRTFAQRARAYLMKLWRMIKIYFLTKQLIPVS